jgi:hypothetical protein
MKEWEINRAEPFQRSLSKWLENISAIEEMPINATLKFHLILLEWLPSRKHTTTNIGEDVEKKEPLYTVVGM